MTETYRLGLPLVQPAQAQKHVTVNEALTRLDGMVQLRLTSATTPTPPNPATEGTVFAVPAGAAGDWAGQEGRLALAQGGGWTFIDPAEGWQGWIIDTAQPATFLNGAWRTTPGTTGLGGARAGFRTLSFDHVIGGGGLSISTEVIPAGVMIFAVSARVVQTVTGSLTSWRLGDWGQDDRYGSGLGTAIGSYAEGMLGSPMTVYSDTQLLLGAVGGTFSGGTVRIAAHYFATDLPGI